MAGREAGMLRSRLAFRQRCWRAERQAYRKAEWQACR
jgi:hypothetical protein